MCHCSLTWRDSNRRQAQFSCFKFEWFEVKVVWCIIIIGILRWAGRKSVIAHLTELIIKYDMILWSAYCVPDLDLNDCYIILIFNFSEVFIVCKLNVDYIICNFQYHSQGKPHGKIILLFSFTFLTYSVFGFNIPTFLFVIKKLAFIKCYLRCCSTWAAYSCSLSD